MKNLDKYKSLLSGEVEGLLLTSRYSRHYAAEFDIAEGVALVSRAGCRYFTDSRYIESAEKNLVGFEVLAADWSIPIPPASTRPALTLASRPWALRRAI